MPTSEGGLRIATFAPAVEIEIPNKKAENGNETVVFRYEPSVDYDPADDFITSLVNRLDGGELTLSEAEFIIDFGYGAGGHEGMGC